VLCRGHQTPAADAADARRVARDESRELRDAAMRPVAAAGSLISSSYRSLILCYSNNRRPDENRVVIGRALSGRN